MLSAEDVAVSQLTRTLPMYEPNSPASHWVGHDDPRHELLPGTVLRAKDGHQSDPWFYVKVTGPYETTRDRMEYGITPLLEFAEIVSAPARGEGGILANYDVLPSSEVREIIEAHRSARTAEADVDATETNIEAARRQLDAARTEQENKP